MESIEIQKSENVHTVCPDDELLVQWVVAAINGAGVSDNTGGVTVRIVGSVEMQQSNAQWRNKDKPTNVLSFRAEFPVEAGVGYLGDILICADVLQRESTEQGKSLQDHWTHIVVHGVLHLLGFDHENDQDARQMEGQERQILATLGVADPYRDDADSSAIH